MIWLHFRQPDGSYHLIKVLSELAESYHRWYDTPATTNIMGPGIYERNAQFCLGDVTMPSSLVWYCYCTRLVIENAKRKKMSG